MGLSITEINNRNNTLFFIPDHELSVFEDVINTFNEKYNDLFDIYSDFRLYENHISFLISLTKDNRNNVLINFCNFMENIRSSDKSIMVIGN